MGVPKATPATKKKKKERRGGREEKKIEIRSGCEAAALGQWVTGAAEPPVQQELRSPGEAAGTGHRTCRIPKEPAGACLSHRAALALLSPGNCTEHRTSGSLLSSPPAFPALRALPAPSRPLCPELFSASYQSKPGGDTLPFCLTVPAPGSPVAPSGSVLVCFLTVEEELHPSGNDRVQWHWAQGPGGVPVPTQAQCWSWGGQCCVALLEARDVLG